HGAADTVACPHCGQHPAEDVRVISNAYSLICGFCSKLLDVQTVGGELASGMHVPWLKALLRLGAGGVVVGISWGMIFYQAYAGQWRLELVFACVGAGGFGFVLGWLVLWKDCPARLPVCMVAAGAAGLVTFVGILGGYIGLIGSRMPDMPLDVVLELFFRVQLPESLGYELAVCAAASAGIWVGMVVLNPERKVKVR